MKYLHFTIGPVQGFVAQARRTRDFWAGSFLLSWLAGVAMVATRELGGEIHFPSPPDDYLEWITGEKEVSKENGMARLGAIPNRFVAKMSAGFQDGDLVENAVKDTWKALATKIFKQDLINSSVFPDGVSPETKDIWNRQVDNFWELSWCITESEKDSSLLDRRKNWRKHFPQPEPGVKCVIMTGWQELSGIVKMYRDDSKKRRDFWKALRSRYKTDLIEGEMLCAPAYIKRRFVRHFGDFNTPLRIGDKTISVHGWKLSPGMPSVADMAAVYWLKDILINHAGQIRKLQITGKGIVEQNERDVYIHCLQEAVRDNPDARALIALDGALFFKAERANAQRYPERNKISQFERLLNQLDLKQADPSPFYAVLLMDGDSLGEKLSQDGNAEKISSALKTFTAQIPEKVIEKNGLLIYAGGDDVLALLPLEDALTCAQACRVCYQDAFREQKMTDATLSGAVIFAHIKTPLGEALRQAHHVLDDIAKDVTGRDAIAVRVLKPGGEHLTWSQPWEIALSQIENKTDRRFILNDLVTKFQQADNNDRSFSNRFFFRLRQRFQLLQGELDEPGQEALLAADYIASQPARDRAINMEKALEIITPLLDQSRTRIRQAGKTAEEWEKRNASADAALLVRFLVHKGIERNE